MGWYGIGSRVAGFRGRYGRKEMVVFSRKEDRRSRSPDGGRDWTTL